ncbi:uncharacterized protein LOC121242802 [Juglans microcarpa x Juglans regia]|uniref:uncharacterized protein LOC121242802 n=1 Tax=Juglans microcarpa x Juglans regia TaxID=2249226 RepID=UPI001B7E256C|nr:uncharacterized protein LOC121242802 [Juglans microcarpa x Juglans regia]
MGIPNKSTALPSPQLLQTYVARPQIPLKGGEKERGIQNDGEFNLEDEENLKSKGTVPVINGSAGSKDSLQDQTNQSDQRDDNYITKGDELKEADHLETENKRVPFWRKLIAYRPWKSKRSSSDLERKGTNLHSDHKT